MGFWHNLKKLFKVLLNNLWWFYVNFGQEMFVQGTFLIRMISINCQMQTKLPGKFEENRFIWNSHLRGENVSDLNILF